MPILSDSDFEKHGFAFISQSSSDLTGDFRSYEKKVDNKDFQILYSITRNTISMDLRVWKDRDDPSTTNNSYILNPIKVIENTDLDFILKRQPVYLSICGL